MASGVEAFSLYAKLILDSGEYEKGLSESEGKANSFGKKLASGLGTAAKAIGAGIAASAAAIGGLTKAAVSAYADYEQLTGGVETLFKNSSDVVMKYAENAYKTAGLSANEYMETVTGFSASLLQSLDGDTAAAAEKADMAITDMADNANKMGTSMESIQNAYQGFAKQNYTMLDNLKLGYGGTKEEMQRLLEDAEKISGIKYDISSYADVVDAIHVMQKEMDIAGTTAQEASTTISGSLGMLKSSWQNLVAGFANPDADMGKLIDDLVSSAETAFSNLMPAIEHALSGIGEFIEKIAPIIAEKLPPLVEQVLPSLINAAITLFNGLVAALPVILKVLVAQAPMIITTIVDAILKLLPMIIDLGLQLILALADGLIEALPDLIPAIVDVIMTIVEKLTEPDTLMQLIEAAMLLIFAVAEGLIEALPRIVESLVTIITNMVTFFVENYPELLKQGLELITNLAKGLIQAIPKIVEAIGKGMLKLLEAIKAKFADVKQKGKELIEKLIDGIIGMFTKIKEKGSELVEKVKEGFKEKVEQAKTWGKDLIQNFINGILEKWNALKETVKNVANTVKEFLGFSEPEKGPLSNFHTYAPDMMDLFMKGIEDNKQKLQDTVASAFNFQPLITAPEVGASDGTIGQQTWNINIYQPMESAADVARAIREESQYGLIGGDSLAY